MNAQAVADRVCAILDAAEDPTAGHLAGELRRGGRSALADAPGFCEEALEMWERIRADGDTVARFVDPECLTARHMPQTIERVQHAAWRDLVHRIEEVSA